MPDDDNHEYVISAKWTSQLADTEISGMLSCFESAFGEDTLRCQFKWKFIDNPFGDSLHLLTRFGDEIVAARSFWRLDCGDKLFQCVDTAVKKEHQGRGVFKRNIQFLFRNYPALGFYNNPNSRSLRQYLKYGWRVVHDAPVRFNFSRVLEKSAQRIKWGSRELQWRYARHEVRGRYFQSLGSDNGVYLWGIRRNKYPVLLGRISQMLDLPVKYPLVGFSYDNPPGFPLSIRARYIATQPAYECPAFYRFDMS